MKMILFICIIFLGLGSQLSGQTMVGLSKSEVVTAVKEDHKGFKKDDSVIKQHYNYLKYVNGLQTRTWIIYFTEEDICRSTKLVCDYGEYDEVLEELNEGYKKVGESEWSYQLDHDSIHVVLARQEWYFTVREARKK